MRLKKKVKRNLIIILIVIILIIVCINAIKYYKTTNNNEVPEVKIVSKVDKYDYKLRENKPNTYKKMFSDLKTILKENPVDEEEYARQITEMFIYDFYSLNDKTAKTDIGGVDFIYSGILENFLLNAQDTYYKYVESNIYKDRKQSLPVVSNISIDNIEQKEFAYGDETDSDAYFIDVSWTYTDDQFTDYQNKAVVVLIHDGIKLSIVELQ